MRESTTEKSAEVAAKDLADFQTRVSDARRRFDTYVAWHLAAHLEAGLSLPYSPNEAYSYTGVYDYPVSGDPSSGEWEIREEPTVKLLAKIIKLARSKKYKVDKKYDDDDFKVIVHLPFPTQSNTIPVNYIVPRQSVCTPKIVGKKVEPGYTTPERVVDVVEWECKKLSFTGLATESE